MIKKIHETKVFDGWLKIIKKTFNDGSVREIVHGKDAAAVGIYNSTGMFLVKQYRGSIENYTWEIPAGVMDKYREDPLHTAIREAEEETSIKLEPASMSHILTYYPTVGHADNLLYLYVSRVQDDIQQSFTIHDDVTEVRFFDFKTIYWMILEGKISDGKTLLTFYKLKEILHF